MGLFRVRPELNDFLRTVTGGQIGYAVAPAFCGRGFATEGLKLALLEIQKRTADSETLLFCRKDNATSRRVMQKSGGEICGETEENFCVHILLAVLFPNRRFRFTSSVRTGKAARISKKASRCKSF